MMCKAKKNKGEDSAGTSDSWRKEYGNAHKVLLLWLSVAFALVWQPGDGLAAGRPNPSPLTEINFSRGKCLIPCQRYSVTFRSDNCASYEGFEEVPLRGKWVARVDFARLAAELQLLKVENLKPRYPLEQSGSMSFDGPNFQLTVSRNGIRRVTQALDANLVPTNLDAIAKLIDGYVFSSTWLNEHNQRACIYH